MKVLLPYQYTADAKIGRGAYNYRTGVGTLAHEFVEASAAESPVVAEIVGSITGRRRHTNHVVYRDVDGVLMRSVTWLGPEMLTVQDIVALAAGDDRLRCWDDHPAVFAKPNSSSSHFQDMLTDKDVVVRSDDSQDRIDAIHSRLSDWRVIDDLFFRPAPSPRWRIFLSSDHIGLEPCVVGFDADGGLATLDLRVAKADILAAIRAEGGIVTEDGADDFAGDFARVESSYFPCDLDLTAAAAAFQQTIDDGMRGLGVWTSTPPRLRTILARLTEDSAAEIAADPQAYRRLVQKLLPASEALLKDARFDLGYVDQILSAARPVWSAVVKCESRLQDELACGDEFGAASFGS